MRKSSKARELTGGRAHRAVMPVAEPDDARLAGVAIVAFMLVMAVMPPLVDFFKKSYQHVLLTPKMAALAASCQPDAAAPSVRKDLQRTTDLPAEALPTAADAGSAQCRNLCALVLNRENDVRATAMFQLAAAAGDPGTIPATATEAN